MTQNGNGYDAGFVEVRTAGITTTTSWRGPPGPEVHLLDGGHFLLESAGPEVAALIQDFLGRRLQHPAMAGTSTQGTES